MNDFYEDVDKNMSDSNIGGRKKKMAKDHLFMIYGIISDVVHGNADEIEVQVMDIEKAFDKLWLTDSLNELVDNLEENNLNDKVALLYESSRVTRASVNTPFGPTEREKFEDVVQQDGGFGSTLCSNSVDKLGKKSIIRDKNLYTYKRKTKIS